MGIDITFFKKKNMTEILATRLDESCTHHLCFGLTIFIQKKTKKGLITFWLGLSKILSYKDLWKIRRFLKTCMV